jgi:hypothetical protein
VQSVIVDRKGIVSSPKMPERQITQKLPPLVDSFRVRRIGVSYNDSYEEKALFERLLGRLRPIAPRANATEQTTSVKTLAESDSQKGDEAATIELALIHHGWHPSRGTNARNADCVHHPNNRVLFHLLESG